MHRIIVKSLAVLGLGLAGCHKCDLCCNVGGPCGSYSQAGRGAGGPNAPVVSETAPAASDQPVVPKNTTGPKSTPKPLSMQDPANSTWR